MAKRYEDGLSCGYYLCMANLKDRCSRCGRIGGVDESTEAFGERLAILAIENGDDPKTNEFWLKNKARKEMRARAQYRRDKLAQDKEDKQFENWLEQGCLK
ncbi:MAG: hypothetical protein JEZ07_06415 [Phycisphaerae bacterium]|nr:hypothetical protein [Phycisphaerae bacterium]